MVCLRLRRVIERHAVIRLGSRTITWSLKSVVGATGK